MQGVIRIPTAKLSGYQRGCSGSFHTLPFDKNHTISSTEFHLFEEPLRNMFSWKSRCW